MLGDFDPKLVALTDDVLFGDVWERTELAPRDRSLITVAALIAGGNREQLPYHLNLAKQNGLTETELKKPSPTWRSTPAGRRPCRSSGSPRGCSKADAGGRHGLRPRGGAAEEFGHTHCQSGDDRGSLARTLFASDAVHPPEA
jgi:hypothetical protein